MKVIPGWPRRARPGTYGHRPNHSIRRLVFIGSGARRPRPRPGMTERPAFFTRSFRGVGQPLEEPGVILRRALNLDLAASVVEGRFAVRARPNPSRAGKGEGGAELGRAHTSRLATLRALLWMKSRRGSTRSPIRVEKVSSAESA